MEKYTEFLNYIYQQENIKYILVVVSIIICVILCLTLIFIPRINKKNKIGISCISLALIILLSVGAVIQKQTVEKISKDIQTESFIEYNGEFEFNKRAPNQSEYHSVNIFDNENSSLKLFDFLIENNYFTLDSDIESGKYRGKIVYATNSKLIVYIEIAKTYD